MTNPISLYGRLPQPEGTSRSATDKSVKKSGLTPVNPVSNETASSAASRTPEAEPKDVNALSLSNITERVKAESDFDRAKVDAIKHAISNGQYPLNPKRIAESFVAIEQMIRD